MKEYTVKVYKDRTEWYFEGKLHREDGPAVEYSNGSKCWYKNGDLHREDGPAILHTNGCKEWCKNGTLHREDGPAIEDANGDKYWYLEGKMLEEHEFNKAMQVKIKFKCENKIVKIDGIKYKLIKM